MLCWVPTAAIREISIVQEVGAVGLLVPVVGRAGAGSNEWPKERRGYWARAARSGRARMGIEM